MLRFPIGTNGRCSYFTVAGLQWQMAGVGAGLIQTALPKMGSALAGRCGFLPLAEVPTDGRPAVLFQVGLFPHHRGVRSEGGPGKPEVVSVLYRGESLASVYARQTLAENIPAGTRFLVHKLFAVRFEG